MQITSAQFLNKGKKVVFKLGIELCLLSLAVLSVFAAGIEKIYPKRFLKQDISEQKLTVGIEIEREIRGGESQFFTVEAKTGDCVRLVVQQKGIDVTIHVRNPAEQTVTEVDRPNGSVGRETATFIAGQDGAFQIQIAGYDTNLLPNKYSILLYSLSLPSEADKMRIAAEKLTTEGESLRARGQNNADEKLLEQAITNFQQALSIWEKLNDSYEQAVVFYGLGWTYIPQSKYNEATLSFARALKTAQSHGDRYAETINFAGIGWSEFYSGNFEMAAFNFNQALEVARQHDYQSQVARALFGVGNISYMSGNYREAVNLLNECLQIRREINEKRQEGLTYITLAKVLIKQGQSLDAINHLNLSQAIFRKLPTKVGEGELFITFGWAYFSINDLQKAQENFERALAVRKNIGDKAGEAAVLRGLSVVHSRLGQFRQAKDEVEKEYEILESLRNSTLNQDSRIAFLASIQEYFEDAVSVFMYMHRLRPDQGYERSAFEFSERSRTRTLLDAIEEKKSSAMKIDNDLLEKKQEIQQALIDSLAEERRIRFEKDSAAELKKQQFKIQDLLFSFRKLETEIKDKNDGTEQASAVQPLSVEEIQASLDNDTVLLEYYLGTEQSYLWLIKKDKLTVFQLPKREIIEKLAFEARNALILQKNDQIKSEQIFNKKATQLSRILLAPTLSQLKNQKLLIIPQGALQYIPFAALPKNNRPLVIDHEIVYLPSASLVSVLQKKREAPYEKEIAIFADPVFSADDERLGRFASINENDKEKFSRLFASRFEAEKISSFIPKDESLVLFDSNANRTNFLKTDLSRYRILHFATHAFIDDKNPQLSSIILSRYDQEGRRIKGQLRAAEIFNLNLNTEMVVLSGCQTAMGKNVRGEGMLGLSRGFLLAGTSRLLISLWEVEDKAAAELMTHFYRHYLKERQTPVAALRLAQIEIMKDRRWRSPLYWSAFILQGDWK